MKYELLAAPKAKFYRDPDGNCEAAYLQIRSGKPVRKVQPDRRYMLSVYLGPGDLIVGIKILEPLPVEEIERLLRPFVKQPDPDFKPQLREVSSRIAGAA